MTARSEPSRKAADAVDVAALIESERDRLSPAERRVADVVLARPELIAFGTVASIAAAAATSGASVVRLSSRLGLDGFSALQSAVQATLAQQLRPAADKIHTTPVDDLVERARVQETANLAATLDAIEPAVLQRAGLLLADPNRQIWVVAGDAEQGVATQFASHLGMARSGVRVLDGPGSRIGRLVADLARGDVVVAVDLRRYERWVLDTVALAAGRGARVVAVTDRRLSPLADTADATFVVRAEGIGPFDSHVGTLAVLQLLVSATSARVRAGASRRLARIESTWRTSGALADG
jgi:DNA-binding MurR/RpiR family transcriptional regulator